MPHPNESSSSIPDDTLPAGRFSDWLRRTREALITGDDVEVACGDCIGCCSSYYFVHVRLDDTETKKHVPAGLLFTAPGLPEGHAVLGYDRNGHCPMLMDRNCTIYAFRPRTCRQYDCRVFAAAGLAAGGDEKATINRRVQQWRFDYPSATDAAEHEAVRATARFIRTHAPLFPNGRIPNNPSDMAVLAIKTYPVFLMENIKTLADVDIARAIVTLSGEFDRS